MKLPGILGKIVRYKEDANYVLPSSLAAILIFLAIILDVFFGNQSTAEKRSYILSIGIGGSVYILLQNLLIAPRIQKYFSIYKWLNAIISSLGLSLLAIVIAERYHTFYILLLILTVTSISILSGRGPTYLLIILSGGTCLVICQGKLTGFLDWGLLVLPVFAAIVITETILRLHQATQNHIRSLETINVISQQINSSLETEQVLSILNAALQKALTADSYFVGLVENDVIRLDLFYDDGEFFSDVQVPLKDTFAGWVIQNRSPLFLPDLRNETSIKKSNTMSIGKNKSSLSWMGVPMRTAQINGLLAVSSYKANAFSTADMELLSNLAQHAALALDNTVHHEQVEIQSRLDSLTGTYNHRYFLDALQDHVDQAHSSKQVISLIMLDIDFFKRYNDSYGHQIGDAILIKLCETIQKYTKKTDFIGRWGGEEFAIALPGARGDEAHQVAERVQKSMQSMVLNGFEQEKIPAPTVSQGISVYPDEATDFNRFIYLADQRLYIAKERGRNQIEPDPSHWENISSAKK